MNLFVRFLEESKGTKSRFETIWPLAEYDKLQVHWKMKIDASMANCSCKYPSLIFAYASAFLAPPVNCNTSNSVTKVFFLQAAEFSGQYS